MENYKNITTLGQLKISGYRPLTIKEEIKKNLVEKITSGTNPFTGIYGYEETVIPDIERALLSGHNILFLGLRGQAKTRLARQFTELLNEYIPVISGSEIQDDPFHPISRIARDIVAEKGDNTPIHWVHRSERYTEKLATPDVSTADLIGDVDPIKAATMKLPYSDERVIHFGLIPHSNRGIFVINELPDLQARIQVSLFNILQEEDIQIRGFKMRLPLDILFVFTANPEDYTNRGSIVTPLKDRIDSQILTHYPKSIEISKTITRLEARLKDDVYRKIVIPEPLFTLLEQVAVEARSSEYVDSKSGVSARLTISAYELLNNAVLRRNLLNKEYGGSARIADVYSIIPAITGKIELVYEGEQEGPATVAFNLIGKSIKSIFLQYFPAPEKNKKTQEKSSYQPVLDWFAKGNALDLLTNENDSEYAKKLAGVPGLLDFVKRVYPAIGMQEELILAELVLHGLAEFSMLSKYRLESKVEFKDMLSSMLNFKNSSEDDEDFDDTEFLK